MKKTITLLFITLFAVSVYGAWDNDLPADNSLWNNAAGEIRANNDALEVVLGVDLTYVDNVNNHDDFNDAITDIGATETILYITDSQAVTINVTVPETLTLKFLRGGELAIATGVTVTMDGQIEAGKHKIFALTGTGAVAFTNRTGQQNTAWIQWWGLVEGIGISGANRTLNTTAFQAAFNSYVNEQGPELHISGGVYEIDDELTINSSGTLENFVLDGHNTTFIVQVTDAKNGIIVGNASNGTSRWNIRNLNIFGKYNTSPTAGIKLIQCNRGKMSDVFIGGFNRLIYVNEGIVNLFERCGGPGNIQQVVSAAVGAAEPAYGFYSDTASGAYEAGMTYSTLLNCFFESGSQDGIYLEVCHGTVIIAGTSEAWGNGSADNRGVYLKDCTLSFIDGIDLEENGDGTTPDFVIHGGDRNMLRNINCLYLELDGSTVDNVMVGINARYLEVNSGCNRNRFESCEWKSTTGDLIDNGSNTSWINIKDEAVGVNYTKAFFQGVVLEDIIHENSTDAGGATIVIDADIKRTHVITLAGNVTGVTITDPNDGVNRTPLGQYLDIVFIQGTGGNNTYTVTGWPASVKWVGGSAPTIATGTNSTISMIGFQYITQAGSSVWAERYRNLDVR